MHGETVKFVNSIIYVYYFHSYIWQCMFTNRKISKDWKSSSFRRIFTHIQAYIHTHTHTHTLTDF